MAIRLFSIWCSWKLQNETHICPCVCMAVWMWTNAQLINNLSDLGIALCFVRKHCCDGGNKNNIVAIAANDNRHVAAVAAAAAISRRQMRNKCESEFMWSMSPEHLTIFCVDSGFTFACLLCLAHLASGSNSCAKWLSESHEFWQ